MANPPVDQWVDAQVKSPWQNDYALPNWQELLTKLSPEEEKQFLAWAAQTQAPITPDYDMRGFWKEGTGNAQVDPQDNRMHYPDTYKLPTHTSFSTESKYARKDIPGTTWNDKNQLFAPDGTLLYDHAVEMQKWK